MIDKEEEEKVEMSVVQFIMREGMHFLFILRIKYEKWGRERLTTYMYLSAWLRSGRLLFFKNVMQV